MDFLSDGKTCNAAAMSRLLAHIKEEAEIVFPAGSFYFLFMRRDVALQSCERITMWDNKTSQDEKDLYYTKGCKNIKKT